MLGDGAGVDALGAGEADALGGENLTRILIDAGARRLDEFQLAGGGDEIVVPQTGDDEDIGVADAADELVATAHLEAGEARLAGGEARLKMIRDMGKADGQTVLRRKHGTPS